MRPKKHGCFALGAREAFEIGSQHRSKKWPNVVPKQFRSGYTVLKSIQISSRMIPIINIVNLDVVLKQSKTYFKMFDNDTYYVLTISHRAI